MSVVLCDLFRSHYDSEHGEKVSKCPLCAEEAAWHNVSCSDLDITGRTEEHDDEERPINKEYAAATYVEADLTLYCFVWLLNDSLVKLLQSSNIQYPRLILWIYSTGA